MKTSEKIEQFRKDCLLSLLNEITDEQYEYFIRIYKSVDKAFESYYDSAIGLLERTVDINSKNGTTLKINRDKSINKIMDG
jgi:hypothetical protein